MNRDGWLVIIDAQAIFADPASPWGAPRFDEALHRMADLVAEFGPERTLLTRWLPTAEREGSWRDYFERWSFADVSPDDPLYDLVPAVAGWSAHSPVDAPTFGKWEALREVVGDHPELVLSGVATDCCVISTALAAADGGARVRVVASACAGSTEANNANALDVMALYDPQIVVVP